MLPEAVSLQTENFQTPILEQSRRSDLVTTGELIAQRLRRGSSLLLDVDGVLLEADSLDVPTPTSLVLLEHIRSIEGLGYQVGLATARSRHAVDYFRTEHGLQLLGTSILEEGQHRITHGRSEYIAGEGVRQFMERMHYRAQLLKEFTPYWDEVVRGHVQEGRFAFTHGNYQWQGEMRRSLWFYSDGDGERDDRILLHYFDRFLQPISKECDLDYNRDLAVTVHHMTSGNNLGYIGLKGKLGGKPINKATALEGTDEGFIFIADGMGDLELSLDIKKRNGMVIGVQGNLDDSKEPCVFLNSANSVVSDSHELAQSFAIARLHLGA